MQIKNRRKLLDNRRKCLLRKYSFNYQLQIDFSFSLSLIQNMSVAPCIKAFAFVLLSVVDINVQPVCQGTREQSCQHAAVATFPRNSNSNSRWFLVV